MRPYRPTCHYLKVDPAQQETTRQELQDVKKGRSPGELFLLSSDEARCSVIPLWRMTLGIKGHRPVVGDLA